MQKRVTKPKISLAQKTYEELEHLLVFCKIEPGTILTELELSQLLNVSRTPIREALKKLSIEGLVKISKSGILVPEISVISQLKLLRLRRVVEKLCMECVIENISQEDTIALKELISELEHIEATDITFLNYLREIHHVLAKATKNEFVTQSLNSVQGLSRRFWLYYAKDEDYKLAKKLHKNILLEILKNDKKGAVKASSKLIDYLEEFARKRIP